MAGVFDGLEVDPLEAQIRQRWGRYGNWNSADQNQAADLARLLRANGISDISQLRFSKREYDQPTYSPGSEAGDASYGTQKALTYDVAYGDRNIGFLGDINRDGSLTASGRGGVTTQPDSGGDGQILAWSSRGGGHTNFNLVEDPNTGEVVVVPNWGSSSKEDYDSAKSMASILAMAAGAYYAPAEGAAAMSASDMYGGAAAEILGANTTGYTAGMGLTGTGATTASTVGLDVSSMPLDWGATNLGTMPTVDPSLATTATTAGGSTVANEVGGSLARDGVRGAIGYGTEGMTGLQTSTFDTVLQATGSVEAATMATKVVEAGGTLADAYKAVDQFMNTGLGKVLGTGLTLAATRSAETAPNDPALDKGITDTQTIGDTATNRAAADDEFFRNTFLPRYLGLMDRADQRDQELYNWNMGRARRAAGQMDRFYSEVDNFDSEANRTKLRGQAGATAQQASDAQFQQILRDLNRRGVNPNSGQALSNVRQWGQNAALTKAHAMNLAGEAARREGLNLRATAAGLRGADLSYAGNAAAGAGMGMNALQAGQSGFNANTSATNSTNALGLDAARLYGSWGLSRTNSSDQVNIANTGGWNSVLGYGLGQFLNRYGG